MKIIKKIVENLLGAINIRLSAQMWDSIEKFLKFLIVGLSNTIIQLAIYYLAIIIFGSDKYLFGQTAGYFCGVINSYFCNSRFVFAKGKRGILSFVKMCFCYLLTFFLQTTLIFVQIDILKLSGYLAPVLAVIVTTPINFVLNKLFAFGDKGDTNGD